MMLEYSEYKVVKYVNDENYRCDRCTGISASVTKFMKQKGDMLELKEAFMMKPQCNGMLWYKEKETGDLVCEKAVKKQWMDKELFVI